MSERHTAPQSETPVSGRTARRKFLREAGTVAALAPAAALLLSASANAQVRPPYRLDNDSTDDGPSTAP